MELGFLSLSVLVAVALITEVTMYTLHGKHLFQAEKKAVKRSRQQIFEYEETAVSKVENVSAKNEE